jgi:putative ABC transport system permease protein
MKAETPRQFIWVLLTLLSHYRRHPGQALAMIVGLVTGVALWAAVQLINDHARASYAEADQLLGAEASAWIRAHDDSGVAPADYIKLRRAGFSTVYPVIDVRLRFSSGSFITLVATDLLALPLLAGGGSTMANPFAAASWLPMIQPPYQAWYPSALARQLDIAPGQQLQLANGQALPPALIQTQAQQGQRIFMDVGAAMAVLQRRQFSYLAVGHLPPAEQQRLAASLPPHLQLVPNHQAIDLAQLTASLHTNLTAMGLLSFAVGLFIVFNAVRFSLLARQGSLTTLREMGVSTGLLGLAIVAESLLWALLGTGLGLLSGFLLSQQLLPAVATSMQSLFGASLGATVSLQPVQVLVAFSLTLAGVGLALAMPLWQRARTSIRHSRSAPAQWQQEHAGVKRMAAVALVLLLVAGLIYPQIDSVVAGFVVLGLVMFGGALLLPLLVQLSIAAVATLLPQRHWLLRWSVSDAVAQLPHLRIALMALLLTLTANIGVTTLVGSFRAALGDWLQTRLSANVYVQSNTLDLAALGQAPPGQAQWLAYAAERFGSSQRWQDRPTTVRGLDVAAPDAQALLLAQGNPADLALWRQGDGEPQAILANEQVHFLGNQLLGSLVELQTATGLQTFKLVGFVHDYGNANFQFYLPNETLLKLWPQARREGVALWLQGDTQEQATAALLQAGAKPGEWLLQDEIKRVSFAIFDRTFAITAALNTLTLLVAGLALLAALLAVHQQRLPEYSHWRAMGVGFRQWFLIVALPLLLMIVVTLVLAVPLGLILSWLLIHDLNVIAFGWTMPLRWTWVPVWQLSGLTLVIVFATLAVAVLRVRQTLPDALKQLAGSEG